MSRSRHATLQRLFDEASELPASRRREFLRTACTDDPALRAEVESLLQLDDDDGFLEHAGIEAFAPELAAAAAPPDRIGPYRVLSELGRGGMGVVYLAEQEQPARHVALKVLPHGLLTPELRNRFEFEAEVLGRLQHPGIAQIFAAGVASHAGHELPFIAMELVRGTPLREFADDHDLDVRARCELIAKIAEAVHHAHQNRVIHRDLKPGNVLVDERGAPKVLDFGIARSETADAMERTMQTAPGQVIGTLAYMSPEQAEGGTKGLDARVDVYALGVLGYELLSGTLPIDVRGQPLTTVLQTIAQTEPPPLGRHSSALRGDLTTILATALAKSPDRRYASAMALADDLRRFLAHDPILARPATATYLLSRFARRHRVLAAAAALVFVGLGIALVVSLRALQRANAASAEAKSARTKESEARRVAEERATEVARQAKVKSAVLSFLRQAFAKADPERNPDARHQNLRQILSAAADGIGDRFASEPEIEAAVRTELGHTLMSLGALDAAYRQFARIRELPAADADPWYGFRQSLNMVGCKRRADEQKAALAMVRELRTGVEARIAAGESAMTTEGRNVELALDNAEANILSRLGESKAAERIWRAALKKVDPRQEVADPVGIALLRSGLATHLGQQLREFDEARALLQKALPVLVEKLGPDHVNTLGARVTLNGLAMQSGDRAMVESTARELVETFVHIFGPYHAETIPIRNNHAAILFKLGRVDKSIRMFEELIASAELEHGDASRVLVEPLANLGSVYWTGRRDVARAIEVTRRAIAIREATGRGADRRLSGYYYDLARMHRDSGRREEYLRLLRESVKIRVEAFGPHHELVLNRRVVLAQAITKAAFDRQQADPAAARGLFEEAYAEVRQIDPLLEPVLGREHIRTIMCPQVLADCCVQLGRLEEATRHLVEVERRARGHKHERQVLEFVAATRKALAARQGR